MTLRVSLTLSVFPWLIAAATLVGCGPSTVDQTSASSTGSGSTGSGSSGSGGAGGGVPAPPPCQHLVQTGDLTPLPPIQNTLSWGPKLRSLGGGQMAIVYTIAVPGMGPQKTVSSNIVWTGAWPPASAPPVTLIDRAWIVSGVVPSVPKTIALLPPAQNGFGFGFADALNGGYSELLQGDAQPVSPRFIAPGKDGEFFVGVAVNAGIPANNVAVPHVGWVSTKGAPSYVGPLDLGCPIDPVKADGVETADGWILARAVFDNDCYGSTGKVRVTLFTNMQAQPSIEIPSINWADVALVPRPGGAWLLHGQPPFGWSLARLDAHGQLELGPITIVGAKIQSPQLLAADALDEGLVTILADGGSPDVLTVAVTDKDGTTMSTAPLYDMPGASTPQIAFDPTTRQALVALALPYDTGQPPTLNRIHVARFACQ